MCLSWLLVGGVSPGVVTASWDVCLCVCVCVISFWWAIFAAAELLAHACVSEHVLDVHIFPPALECVNLRMMVEAGSMFTLFRLALLPVLEVVHVWPECLPIPLSAWGVTSCWFQSPVIIRSHRVPHWRRSKSCMTMSASPAPCSPTQAGRWTPIA